MRRFCLKARMTVPGYHAPTLWIDAYSEMTEPPPSGLRIKSAMTGADGWNDGMPALWILP